MQLGWSLKRASGRLKNRIENLLGLEGHPAPGFVWTRAAQQCVEGVEHVDLLTWRVPRVVFRDRKPLGSAMHVKVANIGNKLRLIQVIADV